MGEEVLLPCKTSRREKSTLRAPRRRDHGSLVNVSDEKAVREPFPRKPTATIANPPKTPEPESVNDEKSAPATLQEFINSLPLSPSISEMSAVTDRTLADNLKTFTSVNYINYVKEHLIPDAVASCYVLEDGVEFVVLEKPNDGHFACYFLLAPDGSRVVLERTPNDSILILTGPKCSNIRYIGLDDYRRPPRYPGHFSDFPRLSKEAMADQAVKYHLGVVDYAVFLLFMLISVGVGIYYAIAEKLRATSPEKHKDRADRYLMGGRKLPIIPVALSVLTSFLSGIALLGTPAEIFEHGGLWIIKYLTAPIALIISGFLFIPIFYHLQLVSIYEYIEIRYHSAMLRKFCAIAFSAHNLVLMAVSIYSPAIALSGVTDLDMWKLILLVGATSTLYTTIGGLKAVVWTDTIQAAVMYAGLGFVMVKGTIDAGGFKRVFEVFVESGRLENSWRFDPNPAQYYNMWNAVFGGIALWLSLYGLNQMSVQRYCSVRSVQDAKKVVWLNIPLKLLISLMAAYVGLLVLAYFYNCNPLETGEIATLDQLTVLLAAKVSENYPGLTGLFIACIFAGTLSVVSGGYNSLAAVLFKDLIEPSAGHRLSPRGALLVNKAIVFLSGLVSTALAYSAGPLGGIIKSSIGLLGATNGPIVGLFLVGLFCYVLPTNSSVEGCQGKTFVETFQPSDYDPHYGRPGTSYLSRISQLSYGLMSKIMVFILSMVLSLFIRPKGERYSSGRRRSLTLMGRPKKPVEALNGIVPEEKKIDEIQKETIGL
ncbi:hypothetical protein QR680_006423 [Steinernema hermaphroditum]|uniref:Uncharacterized protein n=1 Tax=Steinernema hermaphroditum TaxID=289476 RepID=A0AA39HWV1_9BILA|nr:hypothetical protein QR680_006423 [Steinernema hermaphroditum]